MLIYSFLPSWSEIDTVCCANGKEFFQFKIFEKEDETVTVLTIFGLLIVGILLLIIGFIIKKRGLKLLSIIPLAIAGWQLVILLLMGLH